MVESSSSDAGWTLWTRVVLPAPRMYAGLYGISGCGRTVAAVVKIVRSKL